MAAMLRGHWQRLRDGDALPRRDRRVAFILQSLEALYQALGTLQRARNILVNEFGLDPGLPERLRGRLDGFSLDAPGEDDPP